MKPAPTIAVDLNDADKEQLRMLSRGPDGALYKIIKGTLDFADASAHYIAGLDLDDTDALKLARQLQRERTAGLSYVTWLVQLYAEPSASNSLKEQRNG